MNKKKLVVVIASIMMILTLAVGGTLAYFTAEDSDKNVFTVGNVNIDQEEVFDEETAVLMPGNYIQKEVNVKNTGSVPAYIRTIFAFENTPGTNGNGSNGIAALMEYDHNLATGEIEWFVGTVLDCLTVGNKQYSVGVLTYEDAVPAGEYAGVTLESVRLQAGVTQEQLKAAGGQLGANYEILVLSQAVQTDTFTSAEQALNTAFGEISAANAAQVAEWLAEVQ